VAKGWLARRKGEERRRKNCSLHTTEGGCFAAGMHNGAWRATTCRLLSLPLVSATCIFHVPWSPFCLRLIHPLWRGCGTACILSISFPVFHVGVNDCGAGV